MSALLLLAGWLCWSLLVSYHSFRLGYLLAKRQSRSAARGEAHAAFDRGVRTGIAAERVRREVEPGYEAGEEWKRGGQ